jgi:hypothetical protein
VPFDRGKNMAGAIHVLLDGVGCDAVVAEGVELRDDRKPPSAPNDIWAMDFLSDQLFDGSKIRI